MRRRTAVLSVSAALALTLLGACASEGDTPDAAQQSSVGVAVGQRPSSPPSSTTRWRCR